MIEVESYLRAGDGRFTLVGEAHDAPADPRRVEGALTLSVNNVVVLDTTTWDYVDQLWAYVCDMVSSLSDTNEVTTYFPDQPIKLTFRRQGSGRVLVSAEMSGGSKVANAGEKELISELQSKGSEFFAKMSELLPENHKGYDDAVARLMSYRG